MVNTHCSATKCFNCTARTKGVSFFRYPKDEKRCKIWLLFAKRHELLQRPAREIFRNGYLLCGYHFEAQQFYDPRKRNRLLSTAIPTIPPPTGWKVQRALAESLVKNALEEPILNLKEDPDSTAMQDAEDEVLKSLQDNVQDKTEAESSVEKMVVEPILGFKESVENMVVEPTLDFKQEAYSPEDHHEDEVLNSIQDDEHLQSQVLTEFPVENVVADPELDFKEEPYSPTVQNHEIEQLNPSQDNEQLQNQGNVPLVSVKTEPVEEILPIVTNDQHEIKIEIEDREENHSAYEQQKTSSLVKIFSVVKPGTESLVSHYRKILPKPDVPINTPEESTEVSAQLTTPETVEQNENRTAKVRSVQRSPRPKVKHYLAENFDIARLPLGWAPMFLSYKLRLFWVRDEDSICMILDVDSNREIFLSVLNREISELHPFFITVLKYQTVTSLSDLVDLILKLDRWTVCSGVNNKQLVNYYHKTGHLGSCRYVSQVDSLYSTNCDLLLSPEIKAKVCFECKILQRKALKRFMTTTKICKGI